MDRQGNRVRFTRLGIALVLLALIGGFGVFAAKRWWERLTTESAEPVQTDAPVSVATGPADPSTSQPPIQSTGRSIGQPGEQSPGGSLHSEAPEDPAVGLQPDEPPRGLHPLDDVLELAREALHNHREKHHDFTAKLSKTERIMNRLYPTTQMAMKLRYRPLEASETIRGTDLYFKFLHPRAQAGREVIYAPLKYDGKIKAHEGGILGLITVELTPTSQLAMRGNRYPLTEAGIEKLIVKLIEKGERDRTRGDCVVNRIPNELVNDVVCERIEVIHPERTYFVGEQEFPHEFYKAQIWFDMNELVPIKYASFQWPETPESDPVLEEEYVYEDLKLNVGLTDDDFDIENKKYAFP